ncbi:hypothetical protein KGQ27_02610 [Patescibacteria group bacterium]|nr:hypothetical protein [Patescibacteria group bacterium]MDE1946459.1 hypothetical protein [Patescibacteria group bacterium]MDE2011066.1 hypothetical protein [Patescibacteria group bacterium]
MNNEDKKKQFQKLTIEALREVKEELEEKHSDGDISGGDEKLSAAMVIHEDKFLEGSTFRLIDVYLINNTKINFPSVKVLTGAFCSMDDDLMKTGEAVTGPFQLPTKSILKIGASDMGELDYVVWFNIDLIDEKNALHTLSCRIPKYDHNKEMIPLLNVPAVKLELRKRSDESIDEYVKTHDLQPKYYTADELEKLAQNKV